MQNAPQDMLNAFSTSMLKNFAPTLRKVDWFFIVFIPEFFPGNIHWTGTMQSWQPCPNYLVQNFVIFLSNSWENFVAPKFSRKSFHDTLNAVLTSLSTHFRSNSVKQINSLFSNFLRQKVLPRAKKNEVLQVQKKYSIFIFFFQIFSPKPFHGTLRMQFWQLWRKLFYQILNVFCSSSWKMFEIHRNFQKRCVSGQVECCFDNHTEIFCWKAGKNHSVFLIFLIDIFLKNVTEHVECILDNRTLEFFKSPR